MGSFQDVKGCLIVQKSGLYVTRVSMHAKISLVLGYNVPSRVAQDELKNV